MLFSLNFGSFYVLLFILETLQNQPVHSRSILSRKIDRQTKEIILYLTNYALFNLFAIYCSQKRTKYKFPSVYGKGLDLVLQYIRVELFFSKNIYLFINIYIVPFKVIPLRCNILVPALFPTLKELFGIVLSSFAVFISSIIGNL